MGEPAWYLSFDCATKSFAWALLRVAPPGEGDAEKARTAAAALGEDDALAARLIAELEAETRDGFRLAAGGAADLVPGVRDRSIPTVRRIRALMGYLHAVVFPAMAAAGAPGRDDPLLKVVVEFQMGPNSKANTIKDALVATFFAADVFLVGPALKNAIRVPSRPDLDHCMFVEKYSRPYEANKAHAKTLYFDFIACVFDHDREVLGGVPRKFRADFADSVLQVLGFLLFGDAKKAAEMF